MSAVERRSGAPAIPSAARPPSALARLYADAPGKSPQDHFSIHGRDPAQIENAGRAAALDTKGAAFPLSSPGEAKLVSRWRLKHQISGILRHSAPEGAKVPGVCKCGTARLETERVRVVKRDGKAGVRGTLLCGSPWLCPTCAPKRAVERVTRLERVFDAAERKGWSLVFVTLTASHRSTDTLSSLKGLVSGASRRARQGRAWQRLADDHQIEGVINGPEVTISRNAGWHFHQHLALLVATSDHASAEVAGLAIRDRYLSMIRAAGGRALKRGQDVQVVWRREDVQSYLAKGSAAWEVGSAGVGKEARGASMSPWDLAALAGRGDSWATARFIEYALEMPGTRSCVVTRAIAEKLELEPDDGEGEMTDEASDEDYGTIERAVWHCLLAKGRVPDILLYVSNNVPWEEICRVIKVWVPPDGEIPR